MTGTLYSNKGTNRTTTIKFLYSYAGKIIPRRTDGELRYVGGYTRILCVDRSIAFAELMARFGELCGSSMRLKCKLPNEDLDVLVSITSDENLTDMIEEYDRASSATHRDMKIRAILFPLQSLKKISPPPSAVSSVVFSGSKSSPCAVPGKRPQPPHTTATAVCRCAGGNSSAAAVAFPTGLQKKACEVRYCPFCDGGSARQLYHVPSWNRRQ